MSAILNRTSNPLFQIYPYSLTYAIFGDEEQAQNIYVSGINDALDLLDESYKEVLLLRYRDAMTFDEIAQKNNKSRERIRQKIAKGLRLLRHPSRLRKFAAISKDEHFLEVKELNERIYDLENKNERLVQKMLASGLFNEEDRINLADEVGSKSLEDVSIEDLELSVRSYNCLRRAGINNLFELTLMREEDLLNIRNCGNNSANEIIDKAHKFGAKFANSADNNDIRVLNIYTELKVRLLRDDINTIDKLSQMTVDDMIDLGYTNYHIDRINSALIDYEKHIRNNEEIANTYLSDDIKSSLMNKGYITIGQVLDVYDDDWKEILSEDDARTLKRYMEQRGTPLRRKPNEKYIKTEMNPNGNNISDLGITRLTAQLFEKAGITTLDKLTELSQQEAYDILKKELIECNKIDQADVPVMINELAYRLNERDLYFRFTKEMVRKIKIMNANVSFFTKSICNLVGIYTIGDLLDYQKIDNLRQQEGEVHEIDKLIHDAKEMLDKAK